MKNIILSAMAFVAVLALPVTVFGQMYQYIDVDGDVQEVEADNALEALVKPDDINIHSGVMLVTAGNKLDENTHVEVD